MLMKRRLNHDARSFIDVAGCLIRTRNVEIDFLAVAQNKSVFDFLRADITFTEQSAFLEFKRAIRLEKELKESVISRFCTRLVQKERAIRATVKSIQHAASTEHAHNPSIMSSCVEVFQLVRMREILYSHRFVPLLLLECG